jgi:hypothetical protein
VLGSNEPCREWGKGWLIHTVATGPASCSDKRKGEGKGKDYQYSVGSTDGKKQ